MLVSFLLLSTVMFSEPFDNENDWRKRWRCEGTIAAVEDGRGSKCVAVGVKEKLFTSITLQKEYRITVTPQVPVLVKWDARTPEGGAPVFIRVDWFKSDGTRISATQYRSVVEPTQPTMFMTNERRLEPPEQAAFLGLMFHHAPSDTKVGYVGNLKVYDLSQEIAAREERRKIIREER